jgi:leucine-rich repeat/coiled-coil domain-containing protein 1
VATNARAELAEQAAEVERMQSDRGRASAQDHERVEAAERRAATTAAELDVYKRSLAHGKRQIHQLHELLAIRETEHQRAREGKVGLDGPEVAAALAQVRAEQQRVDAAELGAVTVRLEQSGERCRELEAELRARAQHEDERLTQLREAAAAARRQASTAGQQLETAVANEAKMKQILAGMTAMAKEQQAGESLSSFLLG